MLELLWALFFTPWSYGRWGAPALFWGPPGVGKSSAFRAFGEAAGLADRLEILSAALRGEGAFGCVPVPAEGRLTYPPPDWAARLDGGIGLVLLDELSCAPPALQAPLLGLVLDRQIGSYQLGPRVRIMGAANPPEQAASGWDLAAPLANRFVHLQWAEPSAERWADGLASEWAEESRGAGSVEAEETRVLAAWPVAWASSTATIGGFLRRRPELLLKVPPVGDPAASGAWPSPRSWEAAARLYAAAAIHHLTDEARDTLISGAVGQAATIELLSWAASLDLPDPAALLDGVVSWQHDPRRLDRTVAVLSSCAALLASGGAESAPAGRQERLWGLVASVLADAPDASVPAVRQLVRARLTAHKAARPVLARLNSTLTAAGITAEATS